MKNSLTWKEHVEILARSTNNFFHQIKRTTSYILTASTKLHLYKITLFLNLLYGSNCYMPSKCGMQLLEKSQEKSSKLNLPSLSYCETLISVNLLLYNNYFSNKNFSFYQKYQIIFMRSTSASMLIFCNNGQIIGLCCLK